MHGAATDTDTYARGSEAATDTDTLNPSIQSTFDGLSASAQHLYSTMHYNSTAQRTQCAHNHAHGAQLNQIRTTDANANANARPTIYERNVRSDMIFLVKCIVAPFWCH